MKNNSNKIALTLTHYIYSFIYFASESLKIATEQNLSFKIDINLNIDGNEKL